MTRVLIALLVLAAVLSSCKQKTKTIIVENPIKVGSYIDSLAEPLSGFKTAFQAFTVNPLVDSIYYFKNGSRIRIPAGALLDGSGNPIKEAVELHYRQFDDALDIYLSGLPMVFNTADNLALKTAGMFELRGTYKDKTVGISRNKPVEVTLASPYTDDLNQAFFKMDDSTGRWDLIGMPKVQENPVYKEIIDKKDAVKPYSNGNYYCFDIHTFGDVFRFDDVTDSWNESNDMAKEYLEKYGINSLGWGPYVDKISYKGNYYAVGEMLWKAKKEINLPYWVKDSKWTANWRSTKITVKPLPLSKDYEFIIKDTEEKKEYSFKMELITHLRYLFKYTPEQLMNKNKTIRKQIAKYEKQLAKLRMVEYTANIYEMGIYNCDIPESFYTMPAISFKVDNEIISDSLISHAVVFDSSLRSFIPKRTFTTPELKVFKGKNKVLLTTKKGEMALIKDVDFSKLQDMNTNTINAMALDLEWVEADSPKALKSLLSR